MTEQMRKIFSETIFMFNEQFLNKTQKVNEKKKRSCAAMRSNWSI